LKGDNVTVVTFCASATLKNEDMNMPMGVAAAAVVETDEQTDERLVEQVLLGDTSLFELLMRRHNERIYRAVRSIVRDEHEVEDVMQQAYVNAFTHLRQFNGSARFSTWLTRIAVNEALARVRRRGKYEAFDEVHSNVEPFADRYVGENPERVAMTHELRNLLEWAIDTLPDGMREVFVLREIEGMNTAEVATSLGVSDDVVKTRLSRGRATLRRRLLDRTGAAAPDAFRFLRPRCDRVVAHVLARIAGQRPLP
jgi:RNA polymerase sigma-70 factor (ECF subfamily)